METCGGGGDCGGRKSRPKAESGGRLLREEQQAPPHQLGGLGRAPKGFHYFQQYTRDGLS